MLIAALIFVFSLTGAYLIISNGNSYKPIEESIATATIGNNPVGIAPTNTTSAQNLTNLLTQKIADSISDKNKDGFITSNSGETLISAPDPQKMVTELLSETQKNFDPNSLRPEITDSFIKISENNGKEFLSAYFRSFNSILAEASKDIPETLYDENKMSISDFVKTKQAYENAINKFYALTVPRLILEIDKKEIELLTFKKNIFEKLANAEQDPMTALLATNEMLKIDQEFATLTIEINKFIRENSLNLN